MSWWTHLRPLLKDQRKPVIVLFSAVLLMILFCYGGDPRIFDSLFGLQQEKTSGGLKVFRSTNRMGVRAETV